MKSIYSDDDEDTSNNLQKPSFHISSSSSSSCSSSSSSPSSSEKEEEKEESRKKTQVVTKRQQLNDIRLSRHLLEKWCHYPMFPEVLSFQYFVCVPLGLCGSWHNLILLCSMLRLLFFIFFTFSISGNALFMSDVLFSNLTEIYCLFF